MELKMVNLVDGSIIGVGGCKCSLVNVISGQWNGTPLSATLLSCVPDTTVADCSESEAGTGSSPAHTVTTGVTVTRPGLGHNLGCEL